MYKLIKNYLCCSIIYWFTATKKVTSMLGNNANCIRISDHEPGPTLFN